MERLLQDLRYAARSLAWSPGFTAVAVLTTAGRARRSSMSRTARRLLTHVLAGSLGAAAVPSAAAAQQLEQERVFSWTGDVHPGADLRIFSSRGRIDVVPAAGPVARVRARVGSDQADAGIRFEHLRDGDHVVICALPDEPGNRASCRADGLRHSDRSRGPNAWADFTVELPRGVQLRVTTGGGDVQIRDASGRVEARTGAGQVRVEGVGGEARVATGSGAIRVTDARGPVRASTGSGQITVTTALGPVSASTGSGSIEVSMGSLRTPGDLSFSSGSGSILLRLPSDFAAELVATTGSGRLASDFPLRLRGRSGANRMSGTIGAGGRRLRISTGRGDIELRRHETR